MTPSVGSTVVVVAGGDVDVVGGSTGGASVDGGTEVVGMVVATVVDGGGAVVGSGADVTVVEAGAVGSVSVAAGDVHAAASIARTSSTSPR